MKRSLLEMVTDILNDMDSDPVNSIDDTPESQQVAQILKSSYFEMMSNRDWPHLQKLTTLEHAGDLSKPTHLRLPAGTKQLVFFKYDMTNKEGNVLESREVQYLYPDQFLRHVASRNHNTPRVRTITDYGGVPLVIGITQAPRFWTSFDDEYIVCDSYNLAVEDTLKASKSQALIYQMPQWLMEDDYVPDLPADAFSALIEEAKSTAFLALKQLGNEKAEQKAGRQQRWLSRQARKIAGGVRYPNYGRRRIK